MMLFCRLLFGLLLGVIAVSATQAAPCEQVFRVPYDKPHENRQPGYDVLETVLKHMGCRIEKHYLEATIARHHRALAEGKIDILAEGSYLPEREHYAWFSQPYREEEVLLIGRRQDPRTANIQDLNAILDRRLRLFIDEHAWWGPDVRRLLPTWKSQQLTLPVSEVGAGYAELNNARGDVLITTDASFKVIAPQFPQLHVVKSNVYREPVHFMFSKKTVSRAQVDAFNEALSFVLHSPR